ncbi:Intraflagellar transport protein-like protein [Leptomonas pyrrhocoris]|uniref:Intraflagellar transport protein-like protein n=1 Tax=Leptomonas pyrrhocoris TaxID=157538 RepID=A0A0M9GA52_LEPPY|nr:Intraflagellar transport protein-like protein [Leptomonas pyrrhocoris]KPA85786.1 Intraflagellar transport protein-like protein [Leptomonas pyrrhocoris]|eukprot:XP_015664225.1 Intraflagellar transport protein-like protein [Leptomonas pyrrhocoris]
MNIGQGGLGGANNSLRPGTTMRPGSQARPGTTNRTQAAGIGGSLQQPVAVSAEAAVSREGMRAASRSGVGTSAGPGRQVGDRSYYIGLIRPKIAELSTEIERLREQEQLIGKNSSLLTQLQQKSKSLQDDIAKLKDTLADVNVAVENSSSRDSDAVKDEYTRLDKQNAVRRKKVDDLFLAVKDTEAKTKATSQSLEEEIRQLEVRILNENQDFNSYKAARDQSFAVADEVLARQHDLRTLNAKQELLMATLAGDPDKKKAADTLRAILRKRRERVALQGQCSLSVKEEQEKLINQLKTTRGDIEVLERQVNETRDTLQESRARQSALEEEVKNFSGDNVQAFQELQEKDKEMQVFIDDYPDKERAELDKITDTQKHIADLLNRISQALEMQRQMPSENTPGMLHELNAQADAKRDQIQNDVKTHQRLEKELLERKAELDKVAHLDSKIREELQSHNVKMDEQKVEMEKFSDLDGLRTEVEDTRKTLNAQLAYFTRVRDGSKQQLNALTAQHEARKKELQGDEVFNTMTTQEQRIRMLWQSTFSLEDFVRLREKDTQYLTTKAECLRIVDEANLLLQSPAHLVGPVGSPTLTSRSNA